VTAGAAGRRRLVLATRGSELALAQTRLVERLLLAAWPDLDVETEVVQTRGDRLLDRHVAEIGKGAFVKEIQAAVLAGRADVAVHSIKDLPVEPVEGLAPPVVPARADPRDVLVTRNGRVFTYLPEGATLGTSSVRRSAQILRRRSDLVPVPIRGNVGTRLRKLDAGEVDALVVAAAGLDRLGQEARIAERIDVAQMVPAPGQGALALEHRADDGDVAAILAEIADSDADYEVRAERSCLRRLGGGCHTPIGVHAERTGDMMRIDGIVVTPDGRRAARMWWRGPVERPAEEFGDILAELLVAAGARDILGGEVDETPGRR
jgi:hydroxymethylbilane synthase